jgi:hypothetical protein
MRPSAHRSNIAEPVMETRIFGELIPYVAVAGALLAENALARRLGAEAERWRDAA